MKKSLYEPIKLQQLSKKVKIKIQIKSKLSIFGKLKKIFLT